MIPNCKICKRPIFLENLYYLKEKTGRLHLVGRCERHPKLQFFKYRGGLPIEIKKSRKAREKDQKRQEKDNTQGKLL